MAVKIVSNGEENYEIRKNQNIYPNWHTALEKDEWGEPYLALSKLYPIDAWHEDAFDIAADDGEMLFCLITECSHLGGGDWEIIEVEDE